MCNTNGVGDRRELLKFIIKERFLKLKDFARKMRLMFVNTYVCEGAFFYDRASQI